MQSYAYLNPSLDQKLASLSAYQVKSSANYDSFVKNIKHAAEVERGSALSQGAKTQIAGILANGKQAGKADPKLLAPYFGKLKDWASYQNAQKTAQAIEGAASWFAYNVEGWQPGQAAASVPSVASGAVSVGESAAAAAGLVSVPITARRWFWPVVLGSTAVTALVVGFLVLR